MKPATINSLKNPVKIWNVGTRPLARRMFYLLAWAMSNKPLAFISSPFCVGVLAGDMGISAAKLTTHFGISPALGLAAQSFLCLYWAKNWIKTAENTSPVQFTWGARRKRQKALKICRGGTYQELEKLNLKNWNWTCFDNWSKSYKGDLPLSPLQAAVEEKNWTVSRWLIEQGASIVVPSSQEILQKLLLSGKKSGYSKEVSDKFLPNERALKSWNTMASFAPVDLVMKILAEREKVAPITPPEALILLAQRAMEQNDSLEPIELFRLMQPLYFTPEFLQKKLHNIGNEISSKLVTNNGLQFVIEMAQNIQAILDKDKLETLIPKNNNESHATKRL